MSKREAAKQATRAALIAAGLAEFDRSGLDASLDSICERAGLTRGAFYVHFADRDAFVVAVMQHVLGAFVLGLTVLQSAAGGIAQLIERYIEAVEAGSPAISGGGAMHMYHLMDACQRSAVVGGAYRELLMTLRDRIAEAIIRDQTAGRIRRDLTAEALADLMVLAGLGYAARHELGVPIELVRIGKTLLALLSSAGEL